MFRSLLLLSLVSAYMVDARVRRQAEDEQRKKYFTAARTMLVLKTIRKMWEIGIKFGTTLLKDASAARGTLPQQAGNDLTLSDWNPTIRDRFESCNSIATFAPTPEQYCKAFIMCCSMQFDPNNGDKCQTNEQRCIPLEVRDSSYDAIEGGTDAVCIQRNCTELVTTTTTTTTTPELMVIQEPANSADENARFTIAACTGLVPENVGASSCQE
ncbi:unnamed protein product [Heligmosomoides polygyrus]|uniref:Secreted protein n=1 Tax=Heligmosomoides polygyrus TaxID=6339 RepID=A0A183FPW9_HELPZ|nr:unnamed protein product [Heligmosomoides polygyrus]